MDRVREQTRVDARNYRPTTPIVNRPLAPARRLEWIATAKSAQFAEKIANATKFLCLIGVLRGWFFAKCCGRDLRPLVSTQRDGFALGTRATAISLSPEGAKDFNPPLSRGGVGEGDTRSPAEATRQRLPTAGLGLVNPPG